MLRDTAPDTIAAFLGNSFLEAAVAAHEATVADLGRWRRDTPGEVANASSRGLANRIHDTFMGHMLRGVEADPRVRYVEKGPTREFVVDGTIVLRYKRHDSSDKIKSFATAAAVQHWGGGALTLSELTLLPLALGYRWDSELQEMGAPVLSYRKGLTAQPEWVVDLGRAGDAAAPVRIIPPVLPGLPEIDLFGFGFDQEASGQE